MLHPELSTENFTAMDRISTWDNVSLCMDIKTPHALIQLAGYAKYTLSSYGPIFFRGQTDHYDQMRPSLLREVSRVGTGQHRITQLHNYLRDIQADNAFLTNTPDASCVPILQHYGINTTWIDIVDNVWCALWFSCHSATSTGIRNSYENYDTSTNKYSYIYLMQFGNYTNTIFNGIYKTNLAMTVADLRVSAPSTYLRPHSQHALLAKRNDISTNEHMDYADCVVLVLRIETELAIQWIGNSILAKDRFIFPSPRYDDGYRLFLDKDLRPPKVLGSIKHIGV